MIDLDAMIAQREEATGVADGRVAFSYHGKTFTFKDPLSLSDDEKAELLDIELDVDFAEFFMGDEWPKFVKEGGASSLFALAFAEHEERVKEFNEGKSSRSSRSQHRRAASKG